MEQQHETMIGSSSEMRATEQAIAGAFINACTGDQDDTGAQVLALTRTSSRDPAQVQTENEVETLPQGRTALLDYNLRDWENTTYFATRTQHGQHVIGWMFEQVLEKMPSTVVRYGVLTCSTSLTLSGSVRMETGRRGG